MRAFVKTLTIVMGILLCAAFAGGVMLSHAFHVEATAHVDRPADVVFAHLSSLQRWSGWLAWDTVGGVEYGGDDGKAGSYARFPSGTIELVDVKPNAIVYREKLARPPIEDHGVLELTPDADNRGTTIVWRDDGTIDTLFGGWSRFFLEHRAQEHFSSSLAALKTAVEH